jgi:hypothetical protein
MFSDLRILNGLRAHFSDLRILKDLACDRHGDQRQAEIASARRNGENVGGEWLGQTRRTITCPQYFVNNYYRVVLIRMDGKASLCE